MIKSNSLQIYFFSLQWILQNKKWVDLQATSLESKTCILYFSEFYWIISLFVQSECNFTLYAKMFMCMEMAILIWPVFLIFYSLLKQRCATFRFIFCSQMKSLSSCIQSQIGITDSALKWVWKLKVYFFELLLQSW